MQLRVFILLCLIFTVIISPTYSLEVVRNGCVDKQLFEKDWRKYSDFDERIPLASRSWEAQEYNAALDEIKECRVEIARIMVQMELDKEARMALNDYENALKKGLKTNLLKSFWRLAWITYNTVGGPTGSIGSLVSKNARLGHLYYDGVMRTGKNYAEIFDSSASLISRIGKALATIKKLIPSKYSKLPGEGGKVTNVGVEVIIEGLKNTDIDKFILKDEMAIVKMIVSTVMKGIDTAGKEVMPSADISAEEVAILRNQHVELERIKKAVEDSDRAKMVRESILEKLNAQLKGAEQKRDEWEKREKERVFLKLNRECRESQTLHASIYGPGRIAPGDIAVFTVKVEKGSGHYRYKWATPNGSLLDGGEKVSFQSTTLGNHQITVYVSDDEDAKAAGKSTVSFEVSESLSQIAPPVSRAGPISLHVKSMTVTPDVMIPGDIVEFKVAYEVSGIPKGETKTLTTTYFIDARQMIKKEAKGEVTNGNFTGWYKLNTINWKPGRYIVRGVVDVGGVAVPAGEKAFVIKQPDVAVPSPPPSPPPSKITPSRFIGDWEGTGTFAESFGGVLAGQRVPMKIRIIKDSNGYHVYDLMDHNTPTAPMQSREENGNIVFYYKGPAIDTQGYAHDDIPIDIRWVVNINQGNLMGRMIVIMSDGRMVVDVYARPVR